MNDKSYRKNVGLIVLDQKNQLLVSEEKEKTWQFSQVALMQVNLISRLHTRTI